MAGLADALADAGVPCFGPTAAGAALEGSKAFCKEVMEAAGVPTAAHHVVTDVAAGMAAIEALGGYPAVIKADGLAAGKGVIIAADEAQALEALQSLLVEHRFGTEKVLVEEHLVGSELSLLAVCDGVTRAAARLRAGLQTDLRRRPRAEHRRHGVLLAGSVGRRGSLRGAVRAGAPARAGRAATPWDRLPRRPLRGADDERPGPAGAGVQHPLR